MHHRPTSVGETSLSRPPRLAVVTGAASGIGLATTGALLARGTQVVGVDLHDPPPELATHDVGWVTGDVSAAGTWDAVRAAAEGRGGADAFVACAGAIVVAPFLETPPEDFARLYAINVLGVVRGMQALVPPMVERGGGAVAVVCSVNSFVAEDLMGAYSTSKAALLHAVRSAAVESARDGVRINAVCPGIIDTPLLRQHLSTLDDPEAAVAACERRSPIGRLLRPDEVAEALCFLVDGAASAFAGAALTVDGGLIATYDFDATAPR
jgi:NAD(P)-dependent dehydrogenase (short-subunit alcohol dehydrogenase family)